jgi:hypothetical protein
MKKIKFDRCTLFKQDRSPYYNLRVMVKGKRRQFSTGESTVAKATDKAKVILADLKSRGLTETVGLHSRRVDELPSDPTFDDFFDLYRKAMQGTEYPPSRQTQERYIKSLAFVGRALRINHIRTLTPDKVKRFILDYQSEATAEKRSAASVKVTLNSILRNSSALFSKAALAGYQDRGLVITNPFVGLKLRRVEIKGFTPLKPDALRAVWANAALLRDGNPSATPQKIEADGKGHRACRVCGKHVPKKRSGPTGRICSVECRNRARWAFEPDWNEPHPEAYLILLLELGLGLRRHESDKAQKDWFFNDASGRIFLEVRETPFFVPKSKERRVIPVSKMIHDAIKPYLREDSPFIVPGRAPKVHPPEKRPKNLVYRCERHHRILAKWLRIQGINDPKPCHLLRKQFGSYVATAFGLYHAQKFLGHSSPKVTSDYYAGLVELPEINHLQLGHPAK